MERECIRQATEQDIERIASLYTEFHAYHVSGMPDRLRMSNTPDDEKTVEELHNNLRNIIHDEYATIFVAAIDGIIVGLAEVYLKRDAEHPLTISHCYGYLQSLLVSAAYRKSGLGQHLVAESQQWAKDLGATEMRLDVWEFKEGALPFYEKIGYRTLKREMVSSI